MLRKMNHAFLSVERLEERTLLAADIVFSEPEVYQAGTRPARAFAGDVNLDGIVDLSVQDYSANPSILLGNGDGTFRRPMHFPRVGQLADLNNDGQLDMIHPGGRSKTFRVALNEGLNERNEWNGFGSPHEFPIREASAPQGIIAFGDFDGDDDVDVAVADNTDVWVLLNKGQTADGWQGLGEPQKYGAGNFPDQVVSGDLDGDGDLDLVVGNYWGGDVSVLLGNGDGTFEPTGSFLVGNRTASVYVADLDGDGNSDIAASVFRTNDVAVLLGNGDGTFAQATHYATHTRLWRIAVGDLDGDQDVDIVATAFNTRELLVLTNNGDGTFEELDKRFPVSTAGTQTLAAVADFDGDGDLDIAVPTSERQCPCGVNIFLNQTEIVSPGPLPGDANQDGVFDQLDIVQVLQSGKYLTGEPASFAEGDWNNDGLFDQLDIVAALATGTYLEGSTPAKKANGTTALSVQVDLPAAGAITSDGVEPYVGGVDRVMAGIKIESVRGGNGFRLDTTNGSQKIIDNRMMREVHLDFASVVDSTEPLPQDHNGGSIEAGVDIRLLQELNADGSVIDDTDAKPDILSMAPGDTKYARFRIGFGFENEYGDVETWHLTYGAAVIGDPVLITANGDVDGDGSADSWTVTNVGEAVLQHVAIGGNWNRGGEPQIVTMPLDLKISLLS